MTWRPIQTAPKDGEILLYWPSYAYNLGQEGEPIIAIGRWKRNPRLGSYTDGGKQFRVRGADALEAELAEKDMAPEYFSDNDEQDDYGLACAKNAPTHWMPLPEAPSR